MRYDETPGQLKGGCADFDQEAVDVEADDLRQNIDGEHDNGLADLVGQRQAIAGGCPGCWCG